MDMARLIKVLTLSGSPADGEALAALRTAQRFRSDADAAGKQMRDYDKFIAYVNGELQRLNADKLDPSGEIEDASPANATYRS